MQYDQTANDSQIELARNDEFEISLPETRTAGYRWIFLSQGSPACQLLDETFSADASRLGGTGAHRWRFRAVAAGTGEIELQYVRSWEHPTKPERTFTLQVRVRP